MNDKVRENLIQVLYEQAEVEIKNNDYSKALYTLGQLTDFAKDRPSHLVQGGVKRLYAMVYKYQGKYYPALHTADEGLTFFAEKQEQWEVFRMHHLKGDIYFHFSKYEEAITEWESALSVNWCPEEDVTKAALKAKIHLKLGEVYILVAEYRLARSNYVKGLYYSRVTNDHDLIRSCQAGLGMTYHLENRFELALQIYYRTQKLARQENDELLMGRLLHSIGDIFTKMGEFDHALKVYQESLEISERKGDFLTSASTLREIGRLHLKDAPNKTVTFCEKSIDKLIENITAETRGECERLLGKAFYLMALYYTSQKQSKPAMASLVEAGEIFQRYGMTKEQKRAEVLYRELAGRPAATLSAGKNKTLSGKLGMVPPHVQASSS